MRFTDDQVERAKSVDLISYLEAYEPGNLRHLGHNSFCTREHDSLKISNGKWYWFSRGIGGYNALDYLMKVRGFSFVDAMHQLLPDSPIPVYSYKEPMQPERELQIPPLLKDIPKVTEYLAGRGISRDVISYCHERKLLFEDSRYHNCVFLGYDGDKPKFGAVRSTVGPFRRDLSGSDKRFSFCIPAETESSELHLFEAAIDAMSFATLAQMGKASPETEPSWHQTNLLSLSGVYANGQKQAVPLALKTFLERNPQTKIIVLHFDNDEVGRQATAQLTEALKDKYEVIDRPAKSGKDWNDYLQNEMQKARQRKESAR